ncbi:MAG: RluA family pseudouridine synthase [Candidatus Buchananbacteria bacterium]|nr:RluA family pseudouridine synthase [Candidatus Buchananbacteria bacterium]
MLIKIKKEDEKKRLDKFLTQNLPINRSQIKKLIKSGQILVNNKQPTVHRFLKENDIIKLQKKDITELTKEKKLTANQKIKLNIVFENENIIIINKKAGLLVHPTDKMEPNTLVNGLLAYYPKIKNVGDDPLRPGIVHRLDKGVSGLMLVCKNQTAFDYYKKLFKTRQIKKIYTALVHGQMAQKEDLIDMPITRSASSGKMAVHSKEQGGKQALTRYSVIKQFNHFALLEVEILTGRTHQIRAHLNALNHPVVGDPLYKQKNVKQKIELDRIFLHSKILGFTNLQGEYQEFTAKLPDKLDKIIKELK